MTFSPAATRHRRQGWRRGLLVAAAVAACAPYLALEVAWVAGSRVGGVPPEMETATYRAANRVTIALDLMVVALVAILVSSCGGHPPGSSWS